MALPKDGLAGVLVLNVIEATGVPPMDLNGKADPYVVVKFGDKKLKTPIIKKTLQPVWNHQFRILIHTNEIGYDLEFHLWDWDRASKDDFIGSATLNLSQFTSKPPAADGQHEHFELEYEVGDIGKRKRVMAKVLRKKDEKILRVSGTFYPKAEIEKRFWKSVVEYFDIDKNGTISQLELAGLMEGIHADMDDVATDELFAAIDKNGDGDITDSELYAFMSNSENPLAARLWKQNNDIIFQSFLSVDDSTTVGELLMDATNLKPVEELASTMKVDTSKKHEVLVHVRETGKLEIEKIPNYIKVSLRLMYSTGIGRKATSGGQVKAILRKMTESQGRSYTAPSSVKAIKPFVEFHGLNLDEMLADSLDEFANFNEFFYRKLKPSARPIAEPDNTKVLVSPADCRLNVFPTIEAATDIWIKGATFNLSSLLQDADLAKTYEGGSLVIARLAPQDYHRFHSPVTGVLGDYKLIEGAYYTVNPVAINKTIDVYCENKRLITVIQTENLGRVCFIAVGATMVGSINMTAVEGASVKKGDELGYFAFGGSTTLVLLEPNRVEFDQDLLVQSAKPIETLVKVGMQIGVSK